MAATSATMKAMENASANPRRGLAWQFAPRRDGWVFLVAVLVVAFDQLTKWIVQAGIDPGDQVPEGWAVRLVHITNSGAAFGLFQDAGILLVIASVVGAGAILFYLLHPGFAHPVIRLGLALMLGGAIGNLIDRLVAGEVVDFVKFPYWPAFNVADSAITIGVLCLLWAILFDQRQPEDSSNSS